MTVDYIGDPDNAYDIKKDDELTHADCECCGEIFNKDELDEEGNCPECSEFSACCGARISDNGFCRECGEHC